MTTWRKMLRLLPVLVYVVGPMAAIPAFVVGLILGEDAGWAVASVGVALGAWWLWRGDRGSRATYLPFTGEVEPWDLSPEEYRLVDGKYVKHSRAAV